ncbi:hypothetical protein CRG98_004774 [Punica granatum]|uniref:Uncharacterized protein n=1 Tax=Punica granatum TaxID=22663 RepID=A0A2I0L2R3_PUNGR|nr:hypothetical protein CRG98_004774 [Punica granatum]
MISQYNLKQHEAVHNLIQIVVKQIRMEGFIVFGYYSQYPEYLEMLQSVLAMVIAPDEEKKKQKQKPEKKLVGRRRRPRTRSKKGLPKQFCTLHLPEEDAVIILEDESGKVYIVRSNSFDEVDAALGLLDLDHCSKRMCSAITSETANIANTVRASKDSKRHSRILAWRLDPYELSWNNS